MGVDYSLYSAVMAFGLDDAIVSLPSLDDIFEQYGLSKEELNTPCSTDDCTELAMKLDKWELLAQVIGLTPADSTAIKFDSWISYEQQRVAALVKWRGKFGSRATYLNLAEGLKEIDNLDLVEELCKIYKRPQVKCIQTRRKANSQQNKFTTGRSEELEMNDKGETDYLTQLQHKDDKSDSTQPLLATNETDEGSSSITTGNLHRYLMKLMVFIVITFLCVIFRTLLLITHFPLHYNIKYAEIGILVIFGNIVPIKQTYSVGGALLKKVNGNVWKNVVIGGGLLGGLIGVVYWIFMGKNILGTRFGTVIGISVSVVMFGTILAGVLLGMAINRCTFLVVPIVGAACFYVISPDYKSTLEPIETSIPWQIIPHILLIVTHLLIYISPMGVSLILSIMYSSPIRVPFIWFKAILLSQIACIIVWELLCTYALSSDYVRIWPPITGAYFGTTLCIIFFHIFV